MKAPTLRSRLVLAAAVLLPLAAIGAGTAAAATAAAAGSGSAALTHVQPTQELAALLSAHEAFAQPDPRSAPVALVPAVRPITAARTVLPVIGHGIGPAGGLWLRVRLPGRPNGRTGWIQEGGTLPSLTGWHIVVETSRHRVLVFGSGRLVRVFQAVVGKPSTPTPRGEYFVEEAVALPAGAVGAPFALALSARSYVLQEFAGGPGQIALHGLANIGGTLDTAVSHGCVRLATPALLWLVARIGPGTPVTVGS